MFTEGILKIIKGGQGCRHSSWQLARGSGNWNNRRLGGNIAALTWCSEHSLTRNRQQDCSALSVKA